MMKARQPLIFSTLATIGFVLTLIRSKRTVKIATITLPVKIFTLRTSLPFIASIADCAHSFSMQLKRIEVAVRTKVVQIYAESTGNSHWYDDESLYRFGYDDLMEHIEADVNRSNEDFIKHYNSKYNDPPMPPSWMALEVVSFTTLSRLFQSLKLDNRKEDITEQFGLKKVAILENWLHAISNLRNCCAHHSRVWNRRFMVSVTLPYNTLYLFMDRTTIGQIRTNKLFAVLSCIAYILDIISPGSDFKKHIKELLKSDCHLLELKDMGFPKYWQPLPVWREK